MILDNVKIRMGQMREEIDFIKECLWQGWHQKSAECFATAAGVRRFLSWPSESFVSGQKNQAYWRKA